MPDFLMTVKGESNMRRYWIGILFAFAALLLLPLYAQASGVTVSNNSSQGWVQISNNTFGLPANLTGIGCGAENSTTCEPEGVFDFNVSFANSGTFNILDPDGTTLSDQIHFFNDPTTGLGVLTFLSDPNLGSALTGGTTLCTETDSGGCVAPITIMTSTGVQIVVTAASDGEAFFDPFGLNADSSDELQITSGATIATTPEPSSILLLLTGFGGMLGYARRRFLP